MTCTMPVLGIFRQAGNAGGHMWRFIRAMKTGDLVVVPHGSEVLRGRGCGRSFLR